MARPCRMARRHACALCLLLAAPLATAQDGLPFATFEEFTDSLHATGQIPHAVDRAAATDALWADLVAAEQVPFRLGTEAAFLWRGSASSVAVAGDHTGWNPSGNGLARVGQSDVWMRAYSFPEAARLDYKLVVNGAWVLDPANPHQQWSGFGPNSELRMPAWVFPEETVRDPDVPAGTFGPNQTLASPTLGYAVRYRVYTPASYDALSHLPVLYVTDGHEYSDDRLGAMRIVLDNLIAESRSEPAIAVFIDPRVGGENRREAQYVQNPAFASFVAAELVPAIDAAYRTRAERGSRVMLGTSLGGLFSAYLGVLHPEVFGKLAIQSPAFWVGESPQRWEGPSIFEMMGGAEDGAFEVFLSTGTINDGEDRARRMRDLLEAHGHALSYREVPEGHSWGNWRALIDDALVALLPAASTDAETEPGDASPLRLTPYPNPARDTLTLTFTLDRPGPVRLACFDVLGRAGAVVLEDTLGGGDHAVEVPADTLGAAGTYVCRLDAGARTASAPVTLVR